MSSLRVHLCALLLLILVIAANDGAPSPDVFTKMFTDMAINQMRQKISAQMGFEIPADIASMDYNARNRMLLQILIAATDRVPLDKIGSLLPTQMGANVVNQGFQMLAGHIGLGSVAETAANVGVDMTGVAKDMGIKILLTLVNQFVKDKVVLKFIEEFAETVLKSNKSPEKKLGLLLLGYMICTGPERNGHPKNHNGMYNCCVEKLVHKHLTQGNDIVATADRTITIVEQFHAKFATEYVPVNIKHASPTSN